MNLLCNFGTGCPRCWRICAENFCLYRHCLQKCLCPWHLKQSPACSVLVFTGIARARFPPLSLPLLLTLLYWCILEPLECKFGGTARATEVHWNCWYSHSNSIATWFTRIGRANGARGYIGLHTYMNSSSCICYEQIVRHLERHTNLEARVDRVEERSRQVCITTDTACARCRARIGTKLFALYPDDTVVCYKVSSPSVCQLRVHFCCSPFFHLPYFSNLLVLIVLQIPKNLACGHWCSARGYMGSTLAQSLGKTLWSLLC